VRTVHDWHADDRPAFRFRSPARVRLQLSQGPGGGAHRHWQLERNSPAPRPAITFRRAGDPLTSPVPLGHRLAGLQAQWHRIMAMLIGRRRIHRRCSRPTESRVLFAQLQVVTGEPVPSVAAMVVSGTVAMSAVLGVPLSRSVVGCGVLPESPPSDCFGHATKLRAWLASAGRLRVAAITATTLAIARPRLSAARASTAWRRPIARSRCDALSFCDARKQEFRWFRSPPPASPSLPGRPAPAAPVSLSVHVTHPAKPPHAAPSAASPHPAVLHSLQCHTRPGLT